MLATSILSNRDELIELSVKTETGSNISYKVISDVFIEEEPLTYLNLQLKKNRINSAFCKIKNSQNSNEDTCHQSKNFFEFFSLNPKEDENLINLPKNVPEFCRVKETKTKPSCSKCKETCN